LPSLVSITQVGGSGGCWDLVPMSSSTITKTYSQAAALADGLPSMNRPLMKLAVLPYQASPLRGLRDGRNDGHVALTAPSAWTWIWPLSSKRGTCRTIRAVSPSSAGARLANHWTNLV